MEDENIVQKLPEDFYSSDAYASKMVSYLQERTDEDREKPFFAYLPFAALHWPLQAPKESVDKYKDYYKDGSAALRQARLRRLQEMGLIEKEITAHPTVRCQGEPEVWENMSSDVRQKSAKAMEVYAGMVDRMDWNIGRVLDYLKQTSEYDNTFIIFQSDNGAEGASYEAMPTLGNDIMEHIAKYYNNELENIGREDSFVWYGSLRPQAATAPSRLFKMYSTEGGCRFPLVVKPPLTGSSSIADQEGTGVTKAYCTVLDLVPTILDFARVKHPGSSYRGRTVAELRGKSWKGFLQTSIAGGLTDYLRIHDSNHVTGFECSGSGAIHKGKWKIVYVPAPRA